MGSGRLVTGLLSLGYFAAIYMPQKMLFSLYVFCPGSHCSKASVTLDGLHYDYELNLMQSPSASLSEVLSG